MMLIIMQFFSIRPLPLSGVQMLFRTTLFPHLPCSVRDLVVSTRTGMNRIVVNVVICKCLGSSWEERSCLMTQET
jgi:hypothetical protein